MIRNSGLGIAGIAGTALVVTLGLAAWHSTDAETCAGAILLTTCGVLMLSTVGAVCRGPDERPRIVGFAAFGWGYFGLARWYSYHQGPMPTASWLAGVDNIHNDLFSLPPAVRTAHDAWAMAFAVLGSILTGLIVKQRSAREREHADANLAPGGPAGRWRGPVFAGTVGFSLVVATVLASWRYGHNIGAGAAFLLTWAVMGVAVLGAVGTRGRRRAAWFGAASFGIGYLVVAFSPVSTMALPTDHFLNAVFRSGGPTTAREPTDDDLTTDHESRRVRQALHERIDLHFPEHTPVKIVLNHITNAIRGSLGKDLLMYASAASPFYFQRPDSELEVGRFAIATF